MKDLGVEGVGDLSDGYLEMYQCKNLMSVDYEISERRDRSRSTKELIRISAKCE